MSRRQHSSKNCCQRISRAYTITSHWKAAQPPAVLVAVTLLQLFVMATIATVGRRRLYRLRRREVSAALWTSAWCPQQSALARARRHAAATAGAQETLAKAAETQTGCWHSASNANCLGRLSQLRPCAVYRWYARTAGPRGSTDSDVSDEMCVRDKANLRRHTEIPPFQQRAANCLSLRDCGSAAGRLIP